MLNATLCALTRTICCIMENHQCTRDIDGKQVRGVAIPKALVPFMAGVEFLPFVREKKAFDKQSDATKATARKQSAPAKKSDKPEPTQRRASFKVAGSEFPTNLPKLADRSFGTVEEYTKYLNEL
jgi:hypothetical protein